MRYLFCLGIVFAAALPISLSLAAQAQRGIFQLMLNEVDKGEVFIFLREGDVLAKVIDLEKAGLRGLSGQRETILGEAYVSLRSLGPTIKFDLNETQLVLRLTAQPALLGTTAIDLYQSRPRGIIYSKDTSAFLNYALNYIFDWQATNRFNAFGEVGLSMNGNLLYSSISRNTDGSVIRGMTNLTLDNPSNLTRWVFGDSLASSGTALGGSLFMGGASLSREFSLDPYFFRYPPVGLSGALQAPSTVDVYVNDLLVRRERLPPGLFELRNLPLPAGNSSARIIIRDAFGREQVLNFPFYFTSRLLAAGLHEYSYNLGFRRENIARASWDYGPLAFLSRHRLGLTDALTAGFRLEAASGLLSGGPTVALRLPFDVGEMEFSGAGSHQQGRNGVGAALAYTYLGWPFNFGASVRYLSSHYGNLSLQPTDDRARLETNAFVGFQVGTRSSVNLQHTFSDFRDRGHQSRVSISGSTRLTDRANLFLTASQSRQDGEKPVNEIFAGLSYFFGYDITASVFHQRSGSDSATSVELQRSLPVGTGFGFRLRTEHAEKQEKASAILQYQGPYGRYEVDHEHLDNREVTTLSVAGGLVAIGGSVYLTRPVLDSFAVIRVPGLADVRGYAANQEIGRTNSRGDLLVPNLLSYQGNILGIADQDIAMDHNVEATEKTVATPFRGGALVNFPVYRIQSLTGTIQLESAGQISTPAYGRLIATVAEKKFESPIGRQGEFYLENLPVGRHPALVEYKGTTCPFTLEVPTSDAPVVKLGKLRCVVAQGSR